MSVRVYVGNLPKDLGREELEAVFSEYAEDIVSVKLVSDRKTGKCRGFGFVTVKTDEQANVIVEKFTDYVLNDSTLKVEKALPRAKGKAEDTPAGDSGPSRRKGKSSNSRGSKSVATEAEAAQPDPRWADALEQLKEKLAAQTTST